MWYGSDSNTSSWPPNTSGTRFYVGELGYVGNVTTDDFLTDMASKAIQSGGFVQGYWYLGSKASGSQYTDYSWGQYMAQLAMNQAKSDSYKQYYIGLIWADVEYDTWTGTQAENYATVSGFCAELQANGFTPGIYSSLSAWTEYCGSYSASAIAPKYCWTNQPKESASSPPTSMANAQTFSDYTNSDIVLWQYVSSISVDYDAYVD